MIRYWFLYAVFYASRTFSQFVDVPVDHNEIKCLGRLCSFMLINSFFVQLLILINVRISGDQLRLLYYFYANKIVIKRSTIYWCK